MINLNTIISVRLEYLKTFNRLLTNDLYWIEFLLLEIFESI